MPNSYPKLHNAARPGVVGKEPGTDTPPIDLDTMLDYTAAAEVNGQKFDGVDLFLFDPHVSIDATDGQLQQLAEKVLQGASDKTLALRELVTIVRAQQEVLRGKPKIAVSRLRQESSGFLQEHQPLALYWLGLAGTRPAASSPGGDHSESSAEVRSRQQGMLNLLRLPALYGRQDPELAAAGLYETLQAMQSASRSEEASSLRREILTNFGQTYYAAKVRRALSPRGSDDG